VSDYAEFKARLAATGLHWALIEHDVKILDSALFWCQIEDACITVSFPDRAQDPMVLMREGNIALVYREMSPGEMSPGEIWAAFSEVL
jgi:hypothetical protein